MGSRREARFVSSGVKLPPAASAASLDPAPAPTLLSAALPFAHIGRAIDAAFGRGREAFASSGIKLTSASSSPYPFADIGRAVNAAARLLGASLPRIPIARADAAPPQPRRHGKDGGGGEERVLISEVVVRAKDGEPLEQPELEAAAAAALRSCRPNAALTVREVQDDVHRVVESGLFRSCMPVVVDTRDGIRLVFKVEPNQDFHGLVCEGANMLLSKFLEDAFRDHHGKIINLRHLDQVIKSVNGWYQERGLTGLVSYAEILSGGVIRLQLSEAEVNNINIRFLDRKTGEPTIGKTQPETILRQLTTKKGQAYNRAQIKRDVETILTMGIMEDVTIIPQPVGDTNKVDLFMNLVERTSGDFSAGGGISSGITNGPLSGLIGRVCKFWRDIVDVPSFVDRHLSNSFLFHQSIACFTSLDRGPAHMYTFDPTSRNFKGSRLVLSNRFHMSGPCNGLVCAYDSDGNAEILNPTTQRHLYLPVSELKSQSLYSEYFLGFVLSTKEYKMVSIRHRIKFLTFEICTFGTQRTPSWRIVHESAELLKTTKAVIVNDAMYWLLLHEGSFVICEEILMLNLTDEKFSQISLPDSAKGHDLALLEGEGKLHLLSMPVDGSNNAVSEIWVMDYTNQIWVQLEAVVPPVLDGISLFFLCKMKIFCGSQNILFLINLLDGTVSYIRMPSGQSLISCGMFVESFAPAGIGLLNSTASSSNGAGSSSSVVRRSSDVIGWSTADLKRFLARARRRMNMKWKISKRGLDIR